MSVLEFDALLIEKLHILQLIQQWSLWRDYSNWEALRLCFAPHATMKVTVFTGQATAYVENAIRLDQNKTHKHISNHMVGGSAITIAGQKALAETSLTLMVRTVLNGVEIDLTGIGRFYDRFVKNNGAWQILHREVLFDKDYIKPVNPNAILSLNAKKLRHYPAHYRYNCLVVENFGLNPDLTSPAPGSVELTAFYSAAKDWLNSAEAKGKAST